MHRLGKLFFYAIRRDSKTTKDFFKTVSFKKNVKEYQILKLEDGKEVNNYLTAPGHAPTRPLFDRLNIAIAITKELLEVHKQNIIHGDFSSSNVNVDFKNTNDIKVGIIDYDRSIQLNHRNECKPTGTAYEYAPHLAPEITEGNWSQKFDIYSLAVFLFGNHLDEDSCLLESAHRLISPNEMPLQDDDTNQFLNKLISQNPKDRPDAEEVLVFLENQKRKLLNDLPPADLFLLQKEQITQILKKYLDSTNKNFYYYFSKKFPFLSNRAKRIDSAKRLLEDISEIDTNTECETKKITNLIENYKTIVFNSRHCWNTRTQKGKSELMTEQLEEVFKMTLR